MQDPVRPSRGAFRDVYARGYRTWAALWQAAIDDGQSPLPETSLYSAFPNHPHFPEQPLVDRAFSNVATVSGQTTWFTTSATDRCDLPPFHEEVVMQVAWNQSTEIVFRQDDSFEKRFQAFAPGFSDHFPILFLAWAYILSARWAELIPEAQAPTYDKTELSTAADGLTESSGSRAHSVVVDVGDVDQDAARWWAAILSSGSGWTAFIRNGKGDVLHSPWSIRLPTNTSFVLSARQAFLPSYNDSPSPSSVAAARYLSEYCRLHAISEQSEAALAAALMIPVAKFDGARIGLPLPLPRSRCGNSAPPRHQQDFPPWGEAYQPLDRLLTLSCNPRGVKALLSSIFYEPDIDCNVCGAWLQGTFAFLDSEQARDPMMRLRTFMKRDPGLEFLWIGAFLTGTDARCIDNARAAWWKLDLSSAAWTRTHVSFIQSSVPKPSPVCTSISRAHECRLMYLAHASNHVDPPIFPFGPFGHTAMEDTDLDVRQHTRCQVGHGLRYGGFTWDCVGGRKTKQGGDDDVLEALIRVKPPFEPLLDPAHEISVDYDDLDSEGDDETSEMVTRNIFEWLRGEDGFPVAERDIRQHEWIVDDDSDDGGPIQGDVRSVAGDNLGRWLLGVATSRCNSL